MDGKIAFDQVNYVYQPNTPFASYALENISLSIVDNDFIAIVGHTGSGKSTLIQHINGLLLPTSGTVNVNQLQLNSQSKSKQIYSVRKQVGIVFQQPEKQLFEETVESDIIFGPKNFGIDKDELHQIALNNIKKVGLSESLLKRSPFELSGGQMRRVAIAGVLATNPDILVLDEPTAGLDPQGQLDIMNLVNDLRINHGVTVILVTHQMEMVAQYAKRVVVLNHGKVKFDGTPSQLFADNELLTNMNLALPETINFVNKLNQIGVEFDQLPLTPEGLTKELLNKIKFKMSENNE
ncbi:energy-coupling factor transporter ATPase [Lactobacillaceae bacterium Scapto_B20]